MLILQESTTDKLQLTTSAAATVDITAIYVDLKADGSGDPAAKRTNTAMTTATTTDIVATPASTFVRNVKELHIRNKHATLATDVTVILDINGTDYEVTKATLQAGDALEYVEGLGFFTLTATVLPYIGRALTADDTGGQTVNTVQPWFPTTPALTVTAATSYRMRGLLKITHGATSHSTGLSLTGTATLTSVDYYAQAHRSAADTIISTFSGIHIASASNATVDAAGTQAATYIQIDGTIRINAAGTLIPNFTFSANPTGTITIKRNTCFWLQAFGSNTAATIGTWA